MLGLIWGNLGIVVLAALYAGGVAAAYIYGGWRLAAVVATAGAAHVFYKAGGQHERDAHDSVARDIERRREDAYREIDARGTDRHDASERLRKGDY